MEVILIAVGPDAGGAARAVLELEAALVAGPKRPKGLLLKLIGPGGLPHWAALAMHDLLRHRPPEIRLAAQAYTPLLSGDALLWLEAEARSLAPGAFILLPTAEAASSMEGDLIGSGASGGIYFLMQQTLMEGSLAHRTGFELVLARLEEFLPVREWAGRALFAAELREFGLLDDGIDDFLHSVSGGLEDLEKQPECQTDNPLASENKDRAPERRSDGN